MTSPVTDQPRSTLLARISCAIAIFAALLGSTAPSPLYPHYLEMLGLGKMMGTAIFAIYAGGTLAALFLGGSLAQKTRDLRRLILPGLVITALGAVMFASAHSLGMLLAGRFLNGFGTGMITGMASASLFSLTPAEKRGSAAVLATLAFTGGATVGPLLSSSAIAIDLAPTISPFVVIVVLCLVAGAGLMACHWPLKAPVEKTGTKPQPSRGQVNRPLFVLACMGVGTAWMVGSVLMALGADLGQSVYILPSAAIAGLIPAVFQLFAGIGQAVWGRASSEKAILFGMLGIALAQGALLMGEPTGSGFLMLALMPVSGFFYGAAFVGALGMANLSAPPELRGLYISRFYVAGYIANAIPTVVVGYLSDTLGLATAFVLFSVCLVAVAAATLGMLQYCRRRRSDMVLS
ncbi:MFS transporter [Thioclava kandeliae]|uniref:MFS transporter n=1 Tax=Thioclava kandeliae TaxID=3070818 RepID=A0ABV1SDZ8_9RHOB